MPLQSTFCGPDAVSDIVIHRVTSKLLGFQMSPQIWQGYTTRHQCPWNWDVLKTMSQPHLNHFAINKWHQIGGLLGVCGVQQPQQLGCEGQTGCKVNMRLSVATRNNLKSWTSKKQFGFSQGTCWAFLGWCSKQTAQCWLLMVITENLIIKWHLGQ